MSSRYPGRVMALDLGSVRIGVAISDPTRTIAQSYGVVKRKSREEDFARYQQILAEQQVTLLVVGLPTTSEGGDSATRAAGRNGLCLRRDAANWQRLARPGAAEL